MNPLEKFERAIGKVLRPAGERSREPIEVRRDVLREIADQVQSAGGGEYLFPFTGVRVELLAANETQLAPLEAIFSLPGFAEDVKGAIADRGARPKQLDVQVEGKVAEAAGSPYKISYQRSASPAARISGPRPQARLLVIEGQAESQEVAIDRNLLYIGRLRDVVNSRTGLERQNHLAFDAAETTVSRKHARLEYDAEDGKFRLFNDPEQTSVSRDGRGIPCDATRGVQLRSGDELILGRARIRFEILTE
jgi:hypothetical protein